MMRWLGRLDPPDSFGESRDGRLMWALAAFLVLLHLGLAWVGREPGVHVMRDDARYLILAQSLSGFEFRDLYRIDAPLHTLYPPGYPLVLMVWGALVGGEFTRLVTLNVILSGAGLLLLFAALVRVVGPGAALLCLVPVALNPLVVGRAGSLRSETLYIFLSLGTLWAPARRRPSPREGIVGGASAIGAALVRINGLPLLAATGTLWLLRRRWRALAGFVVAAGLTEGVWLVWGFVAQERLFEGTYLRDLVVVHETATWLPLWKRLVVRVVDLFVRALPASLSILTIEGTPIDNAISVGIVCASLGAGLVVFLRRWTIAALYLLFFALTLIAWPFLRPRFIEPVLPLLIPAIVLGGAALAGAWKRALRVPAAVVLALAFTAMGAV
ncbi:MAG: hypothetical protein ACRELC_00165, partial [Gemmatimonadota bacterium]